MHDGRRCLCWLDHRARHRNRRGLLGLHGIALDAGVGRGNGWRRSRCITTFEGRPSDAATILGHLAEYFGKEQQDDKPHDDRHM